MTTFIFLLLCLLHVCNNASNGVKLVAEVENVANISYPVVLVPGLGGSQAYCTLKDNSSPAFHVWIRILYFLMPQTLFNYFSLRFNWSTNRTEDNDICDISFPDWGHTRLLAFVSPSGYSFTIQFKRIIDALERHPYYISNYTLRGAPYDFRKAPNDNEVFVQKLKVLVEETYINGKNRPVVLIGHSLGGIYLLYFLKHQTREWKQKYVHCYMPLNSPFGGSVMTIFVETVGPINAYLPLSPMNLRPVMQSMSSVALLLPDPLLWGQNESLVITPEQNYTAHDFEEYFQRINHTIGYEMMKHGKQSLSSAYIPEDIPNVYCVFGTGLLTPNQLIFRPPTVNSMSFPDQIPIMRFGDGDGSVNARSLRVCTSWPNIRYEELVGVEHKQILLNQRLIDLIVKVAGAETEYSGNDN